jgi:mannose-1-phosphate guanylyltransferase
MNRWAVILAGGVGSRFWPLSTPSMPKQLLALVGEQSLLAATLNRLAGVIEPHRILVLTNEALVERTLAIVPQLQRENIIAEPRAAGTAAALAWAAHEIVRRDGEDAVMICLHADWHIGDEAGFRASLLSASQIVTRHDSLVTVGVVPSRPDPGFGYIQPGEAVSDGSGARHVARFVEKPDRANAEKMVANGFLWNSGIFVWRAQRFLDEIRLLTPEVSVALDAAKDPGTFFSGVTPVSVDVGVLERSKRVMVIPGDFSWDDIGNWSALGRALPKDENGNAVRGRAVLVDATNNVVYAEDSHVVLYGVHDLVVVSCGGVTFVTKTSLATDLKTLVSALPAALRDK